MKMIDVTNQRKGMLTAIRPYISDRKKGVIWECQCDCGNKAYVPLSNFKKGRVKSCGCMRYKWVSQSKKRFNKYIFVKDFVIGYTRKNEPFILDISDYGKIKNICWHSDGKGYICGYLNKKQVFLHRLIMGVLSDDTIIDHINHNGYDNRKNNLRCCTTSQNNCNRNPQSNTISGIRGVYYDKARSKWRAYIISNGKYHNLGRYEDISLAIEARKKAAQLYFKDFCPLTYTGEVEKKENE